MMDRIYLDYSATTFVDDSVLDAMIPYFKKYAGNPSGMYSSGREAKAAVENSRQIVADCINTRNKKSADLIYTLFIIYKTIICF